jgi:anti-anti-sigma factor
MPIVSLSTRALVEDFNKRSSALELNLTGSADPPALVVGATGLLDTDSSPSFYVIVESMLAEAQAAGGLILDVEHIRYISSAGVGVCMTLFVETTKQDIPYFLYKVPACVRSVIGVLGYSSYFSYLDAYKAE